MEEHLHAKWRLGILDRRYSTAMSEVARMPCHASDATFVRHQRRGPKPVPIRPWSRYIHMVVVDSYNNPTDRGKLGGPTHLGIPIGGSLLLFVPFISLRVSFGGLTCGKGLLKVVENVINVLGADGNPDEVFGDTAIGLFFIRELLVCGGPRVDGQRFGVTDAVKQEMSALTRHRPL